MNPLEPFAVYSSNELPDDRFVRARTEYDRRLDTLFMATPVPFRSLTDGDCDHDMRLLPGVETPGTRGLDPTARQRPGLRTVLPSYLSPYLNAFKYLR
ncbi:hypothetical protein ACFRU3_19930 [Streptomyces sp. NPDC056910]|uniref:hypothetical protein n=1 Tax=Streptomyces sp. NPDC056910 TaxID=3345964 RepID=UPI00368966D8